jgi:peptide deformylase
MIEIVPPDQMPKLDDIKDVPTSTPGDLLNAYKHCLQLEELCDKKEGIGIAAVQVGLPWKLFLIKSDGNNLFAPKGKYAYFVNCAYEPTTNSQTVVSLEGCLSLRSRDGRLRHFQVERHSEITLSGQRLFIASSKIIAESINNVIGIREQGIVVQHELDHCAGVLISDVGNEIVLWRN